MDLSRQKPRFARNSMPPSSTLGTLSSSVNDPSSSTAATRTVSSSTKSWPRASTRSSRRVIVTSVSFLTVNGHLGLVGLCTVRSSAKVRPAAARVGQATISMGERRSDSTPSNRGARVTTSPGAILTSVSKTSLALNAGESPAKDGSHSTLARSVLSSSDMSRMQLSSRWQTSRVPCSRAGGQSAHLAHSGVNLCECALHSHRVHMADVMGTP